MPLSRPKKNVMRKEIGINPRGMRDTDNVCGEGNNKDQAGTTRQWNFPKGVKNSGPKYKQPDPRTEGKGGPLSAGVAPKLVK
jgi:hypothetical protein